MQHYYVIIAGASPGKQKCGLRYVKTALFCTCGSNNWETVKKIDGYAARGLASTELSFHSCNVLRDCRRGVPRANKKMKAWYVKMRTISDRAYSAEDKKLSYRREAV